MPAKTPTDTGVLFNRQHYDALRRERRSLNDVLGLLDKAQACGIECDFLRKQRDEVDAQLAAIEQHFMTPAPKN